MKFFAVSALILALAGYAMAFPLCGLTRADWRLRRQVHVASFSDAKTCFQTHYGDATSPNFAGNLDKFLINFTSHNSQDFDMEEAFNGNTWVNEVTGFNIFNFGKCASGTHEINATINGNNVSAAVEGVFAIHETAGKIHLYYGLKSCVALGSTTDEELDEMCNTRIPTHHLTNIKRGACLLTNCGNGVSTSSCASLTIDPDV